MKRKQLNPKGLLFVVLSSDLDQYDNAETLHVAKRNLLTREVSKTACGIGGVRDAFAFPFFWNIWRKDNAPVCESCYGEVAGRLPAGRWLV